MRAVFIAASAARVTPCARSMPRIVSTVAATASARRVMMDMADAPSRGREGEYRTRDGRFNQWCETPDLEPNVQYHTYCANGSRFRTRLHARDVPRGSGARGIESGDARAARRRGAADRRRFREGGAQADRRQSRRNPLG